MLHNKFLVTLVALSLPLFSLPASAGGTEEFANYSVHYNALPTDQLSPAVASAYGIVRSKNRALLNVAITRKVEKSAGIPVEGNIKVAVSNLTGQVKNMTLRKVEEKGEVTAIYYLGETNVADGEILLFEISVTPEGSTETLQIKFQQQFFAK